MKAWGLRLSVSGLVLERDVGSASLEKIGHAVATGELAVGHLFTQEFAEWASSIANAIFQQILRRRESADLRNVILVDLLALAREVAAKESLEEFREHGMDSTCQQPS
jgi:hypothetical protein